MILRLRPSPQLVPAVLGAVDSAAAVNAHVLVASADRIEQDELMVRAAVQLRLVLLHLLEDILHVDLAQTGQIGQGIHPVVGAILVSVLI